MRTYDSRISPLARRAGFRTGTDRVLSSAFEDCSDQYHDHGLAHDHGVQLSLVGRGIRDQVHSYDDP